MRAFDVEHLSVERLLSERHWLVSEPATLIARNALGDLFLLNDAGRIFTLEVLIGQLSEIAESEDKFRDVIQHV